MGAILTFDKCLYLRGRLRLTTARGLSAYMSPRALATTTASSCNMIWSLGSSTQLHKLIILQKRLIRIISKANYLSHTDLLFHSLNLLKITDIGQMQTNFHVRYKYHHGVLPTTFVNYLCKVADVHSYLTRQSSSLHISYARTNQRKNTIKIKGPKLWYKQPLLIRDSPSLKILKLRTKTEIVSSYLPQYHS